MRWDEFVIRVLRRKPGVWFTSTELIDLAATAAKRGEILVVPSGLPCDAPWGAVLTALKQLHNHRVVERQGGRHIMAQWRVI